MYALLLRLLPLCLLLSPALSDGADLRLHGSNTIGAQLAPALVRAWLDQAGASAIELEPLADEEIVIRALHADGSPLVIEIHSHGSGTAFTGLRDGRADIGMSSRPVTARELEATRHLGALDRVEQEIVLALDGLAVIVHPSNPIGTLSVSQIRALFSGRIQDWSELGGVPGPVRLHARDDQSGTFDTFRALVLGSSTLTTTAARYESNEELANQVLRDPLAIGFVGLAAAGRAKAVQVRHEDTLPLAPEPVFVATEDYPLARRLFLYLPAEAKPLAVDFIEFAVAEAGQRVVEEVGYVSQNLIALEAPRRADAGHDYLELTKGALRLPLNFRFGSGATLLDSKAMRDLDRLAAFMRAQSHRGWQLVLIGFADAAETFPFLAEALSTDRADHVAEMLIRRGVSPHRVRGLGGVAPVASNDDEAGRERNRRVEVWVLPAA